MNDRGFQWRDKTLTLHAYIQPNATETAFAGLHNGCLKFRVNAPPVEGKANAQLTLFLSRLFAVPKKSVHLQQGTQSRYKKVVIHEPRQLPDWIDPAG